MKNLPAKGDDLRDKVRELELHISNLEKASKLKPIDDEKYRDLLMNLPVGVIIYNTEFKVVYINEYVARMFGLPEPDLKYTTDLNIFNYLLPEYHETIRERFRSLLKGLELDFYEVQISVPGKRVFDIQVKSTMISFEGKPAAQTIFIDITRSKIAEEESRVNNRRVASILDSIDELVYLIEFSPDGSNRQIRFISSQISQMLGISPEEYVSGSEKLLSHCHPDDVSRILMAPEILKKNKKPVELIYRFRRKDDQEYSWIEERILPQFNEKKEYTANLGIMRVVTDRINYESRLKESEAMLNMVLNSIDEVVYYMEFSGDIRHLRFVSNNIEDIIGFTSLEFRNHNGFFLDYIHPDDLPRLKLLQGKALVEGKTAVYNYRFRHKKTGKYIWIEERVFPKYNEQGIHIANFGVTRDITEIKEAELALKINEEKFRMLAENARDVIFKFSLHPPHYEYVSPFIFELTGYTPEEFYADPYLSFKITHKDDIHIVGDSEKLLRDQKAISNVMNQSITLRWVKKDGSVIWTETRNIPVFDEQGKVVAIEGISRDITQNKKDEDALRDSEERFRILSNASFEGVVLSDRGVIIDVNERFLDIFGYKTREEVIGKPIRTFVIRDSKKFVANRISNTGPFSSFEIVCRKSDGSEIFIEARGQNIPYNGKKIRITSINDITQRKLSENTLKESRERYKNLIESSPDGIFIHDQKGNVLFANPAILKMLGVSSLEEFGTKSIYDYSLADDMTKYRRRGRDLVEGKDLPFVETKIRRRDGSFLEVESKPILFNYLGQPCVLIFCRDISFQRQLEKEQLRAQIAEEAYKKLQLEIEQRQRTERQLQATQKYTRRLIDSSLDMICACDKAGYITEFNHAAQKTFGYTPEEVMGQPITFLYGIPGQWMQVNDELFLGSGAYSGEIVNKKKNGVVFTSFISASVIKNDSGEVIGTMGVSRDITELKKTEEQINLQAAKLNSIIESSSHYIWTFSRDMNLTSFNLNFAQMMFRRYGYQVEVGSNLFKGKFVSSHEHNDFWLIKSLAAFNGIPQNFENSFYHQNTGTTSWMEVFLNPIYGVDNKVSEISGIGHDITEKKLSEEKLKQSLKEKEVLLKEVHHRVKNNLQVISSILNLQSSYVKDKRTLEILRESQNRIKSMAFIHESLYQTKDFSSINFTEYVTNLTSNLVHSYQGFEDQVILDLKVQEVYLNLDLAIPCGLIINEILSNALKYAFPKNRKGKINLRLSHKNQEISLVIQDDGIGLPEHIDYRNTESLGLQLVVTLVDQLGGQIRLDRSKGTKFTIVFRNPIKNS
ncbi:MAG: PAS domain S-box protein [Bacteroidia bacterium]